MKPSCVLVSACTQYVHHELLSGSAVSSERGETEDAVTAAA